MTITSSVFETYYTLANVNSTNNKFYYDNEKIVISEESYELRDIERYLKHDFFFSRDAKENKEFSLVICANNNTTRSEIKCVYWINFKSHNIGSLVGFSSNRVLEPQQRRIRCADKYHHINIIRINVIADAYSNDRCVQTIHEFSPSVYIISKRYMISKKTDVDHLPLDRRTEHYGSNDWHNVLK